jgi:hypothetical protein
MNESSMKFSLSLWERVRVRDAIKHPLILAFSLKGEGSMQKNLGSQS